MKHFNKISTLLLTTAVAATLPLAAGVFKKVSSATTSELSRREMTGASPRKHQAPPTQEPATSGLRLRGLVINAGTSYIGEITVDGGNVKVSNIHSSSSFDNAQSAVYADGRFYTQFHDQEYVGVTETTQIIYDADTWDIIEERNGLMPSSNAVCMTYDPSDCSIYGYFVNDDNDDTWLGFGRMNIATGETFLYNSVDQNDGFMCIAASPDGYLYGVNTSGQYCRIDKKTGVITVLGHTDVKPMYIQSATFDWSTGDFYWAAMTDTGESILYTIDPVTYMARKIGNMPSGQEFIGLYVAENPSPALTPAAVTGIEAFFEGSSLSGTVSFDVPETTVDGKALTGNVTAHVAVDGKSFEAQAQPGQRCSIPVNVSEANLYIINAWVSDEKAQGKKTTLQKWIGPDYPAEVKNVVCVNDNGHITLTWEAPSTVGQHGGYVDIDDVTYVIGRNGGGSMAPILDIKGYKFEQDFDPSVAAKVKYYVRPVYKELVGPITYSNEVTVGNAVNEVPFSYNASNSDGRVIIDANSDGTTWESSWGYAMCETPDGGADDWLLTPAIALKGGQIYELNYEVSSQMGILYPQVIEVKAGIGDKVADMTVDIDSKEVKTVRLTQADTETVTFTAPSTGNYRLAFRNASTVAGTLGLLGIDIKALGAAAGPAAPSDCKVEAAPMGQLKATISFTASSKDSEGNAIEALSKIEVFRGNAVIATVENPVPGNQYSVTDDNAAQGDNTYEIGAVSADGTAGVKAKVNGWVGIDIPALPYDITLKEEGDGAVVAWKLPETGIHNGYIKPEEVIVSLLDPTYLIEIASVMGVDNAVLHFDEMTEQAILNLALSVSNKAGVNPQAALTPTITVGPPFTLPFFETFPNGKVKYPWSTIGTVSDDEEFGWMPVEDKGPDGEVGVSTYWGYFDDDEQGLRSLRISLKDATEPALRFYLMTAAEEGSEGMFIVQIAENFEGPFTTIYEKTATEDIKKWEQVEVDLAKYAGKDVYFQFVAVPDYGGFLVGLDDISVRSACDYDASFEAISLDKSLVEVGVTAATVNARVQNHGVKDLADGSYNVNFYAGDRLFATLPGRAMPAAFGQSVYKTEYAPDIDDLDPSAIWAEIVSDLDGYSSNDKSAEVSVDIDKPICPAVEDLKAEVEDGQAVVLTWSQPDQSGFPVREITDDFEAYRNFAVNNAGEWTIIDEDQSPGVGVSYFFPGSTGNIGWVVMEPASIPRIGGGTNADRFPPYSGDKYIVAYNPSSGDNKDWLITPELSGRAQEISFMARAESAKQGREMFEVYYSKTGTDIADMIRLDNTDWRTTLEGWEQFRFQVPEGAKYFAVRCVSHNRVAMHIDDFKYESAATPLKVKLLGYNVYRNGVRINDEVLTSPSFRDVPDPRAESVVYTVRAVYDRGEASHSNSVTIYPQVGIDRVYMNVDPGKQPVYDLSGRRMQSLTDGEIYVTKGFSFIYKAK